MTPKFRAWDNGMEMMVYQGDDEIYICFDGEKWKLLDYYGTHWETDEYGMNEIEQPWEVENIEIMQWTGLKDSQGVEIYEGDIVKRTYLFDGAFGKTHIGEVVYDKESARYVISKPNKFIEPKTEDLGSILSYRSTYEVIGNIWEDGDLIDSE